jgi:hypothetical protein
MKIIVNRKINLWTQKDEICEHRKKNLQTQKDKFVNRER